MVPDLRDSILWRRKDGCSAVVVGFSMSRARREETRAGK